MPPIHRLGGCKRPLEMDTHSNQHHTCHSLNSDAAGSLQINVHLTPDRPIVSIAINGLARRLQLHQASFPYEHAAHHLQELKQDDAKRQSRPTLLQISATFPEAAVWQLVGNARHA